MRACRANAVKVVAEACQAAADSCPELRIAAIKAGDKRNAIAREGSAVVLLPAEAVPLFETATADYISAARGSYIRFETGFQAIVSSTEVRNSEASGAT